MKARDQTGAAQHVARVLGGESAIQDVAVLIADLTSRVIGGLGVLDGDDAKGSGDGADETIERIERCQVSSGHDVDPRVRIGVGELYPQLGTRRGHVRDVEGSTLLDCEHPVPADRPAVAACSPGDPHCDVAIGFLQPQAVVARLESPQLDEAAADRHVVEGVARKRATALLQK